MDYPIDDELIQRAGRLALFFSCSPMDFLPALIQGRPQVWLALEAFMNTFHEQQQAEWERVQAESRKASGDWRTSFFKMAEDTFV